jgi:hypothetical protein
MFINDFRTSNESSIEVLRASISHFKGYKVCNRLVI